MGKLPRDHWRGRERLEPVLSAAELDALPDPVGAWWRSYHARVSAAVEAFEAEYGEGSAEAAMLSVWPQPAGALGDDDGSDPGPDPDDDTADLPHPQL